MRLALRYSLKLLALLVFMACAGAPGDGEPGGEPLGSFDVLATERSNDCGPGALGAPAELSFEVNLSRLPSEFFWNDRPATVLGPNQFELTEQIVAEVRDATLDMETRCSVQRSDRISVSLQEEDGGEVVRFDGEMSFAFRSPPESYCLPADVRQAGVERLPCTILYDLAGRQRQNPNQDF